MARIHQHAKFQAIRYMRSPENAQKHQIWPILISVIMPKLGKATDCGQSLVSSEGGWDTSICQISGHSFNTFSKKSWETSQVDRWMDADLSPSDFVRGDN